MNALITIMSTCYLTILQWVIADPSVSSSDSTSCDIGGFRLNSCIGIIAEAVIKLYSLTANFMCGYLFKELFHLCIT